MWYVRNCVCESLSLSLYIYIYMIACCPSIYGNAIFDFVHLCMLEIQKCLQILDAKLD